MMVLTNTQIQHNNEWKQPGPFGWQQRCRSWAAAAGVTSGAAIVTGVLANPYARNSNACQPPAVYQTEEEIIDAQDCNARRATEPPKIRRCERSSILFPPCKAKISDNHLFQYGAVKPQPRHLLLLLLLGWDELRWWLSSSNNWWPYDNASEPLAPTRWPSRPQNSELGPLKGYNHCQIECPHCCSCNARDHVGSNVYQMKSGHLTK